MSAEATSNRPAVSGQDLTTVAAGVAIGGGAEIAAYVLLDVATGGALTLCGLVGGVLVAMSDKESSK